MLALPRTIEKLHVLGASECHITGDNKDIRTTFASEFHYQVQLIDQWFRGRRWVVAGLPMNGDMKLQGSGMFLMNIVSKESVDLQDVAPTVPKARLRKSRKCDQHQVPDLRLQTNR